MTATDNRDATEIATIKEQLPYVEQHKPRRTGLKLLGILVVWLVGYFALSGQMTKALGLQDTTERRRHDRRQRCDRAHEG